MYNKITPQKLKWLYIFKYFFQLTVPPVIFGCVTSLLDFVITCIRVGYQQALNDTFFDPVVVWGIQLPNGITLLIFLGLIINILNILSVIPFIGLIEDLFTKNDVIEKEITFASVFPMIELQCARQSKRFICDTFSRKDNSEVFVIDENKKYYRLLWNENYGSKAEFEKFEKAERLKIQYLRHSRIIVGVEVLE